MSEPNTLLLNSTYEPLRVISWKRAIMLWVADKVEIVEEYDDYDIKTVSFTMKCPAVVRLLSYVRGNKTKIKFSRVNIFSRDKYKCQYCGKEPGVSGLTFDHVIPRSRGGKTEWENIITSCYPCNSKKGSKTPEEAKMKLLSKPTKPDFNPRYKISIAFPKTPEQWRDYLYWNQELKSDEN